LPKHAVNNRTLLYFGSFTEAVTCSTPEPVASRTDPVALARGMNAAQGQLWTGTTRSTLPDRPMTTQNDLITTASNLTTAKKAATETAAGTEAPGSWSTTTAVARGMSSADVAGATIATSQSAQIGLTTQAAERQTEAAGAGAAGGAGAATGTAAEMLISTIYPASAETDVRNSIEKMANASHPVVPDSLTKGFSIPTFLPPFPVFAAADLPAYRAAADAAEAAKLAAEAAKVAKAEAEAQAAKTSAEAVTISPEEQRRQVFNEQQSYLTAHREGGSGRNLTMPVLNITAQKGNHAYMPCQVSRS